MKESNVIQMLVDSQSDIEWYGANFKSLINKFEDSFIAILNKTVIDSDADLDKLIQKLETKKINSSNLTIKFVSKMKSVLL